MSRATKAKIAEAKFIWGDCMINLSDPTLDERLRRRTPEGRYEISDIELVLSIRAFETEGDMVAVNRLCEVLLKRCASTFQFCSVGLSHRPDLREDVIANMGEQVLREARNPNEVFMTKNFIHAVRCICADEFNRMLRQEGLTQRRDDEGRPAVRPHHVPRSKMEPIRPAPSDDEGLPASDVADPFDQYEHMHAEEECQRILTYLADPLDRKIMLLRAIERWKWDDIALLCERTERTVRLRFERARNYLQQCLIEEQQTIYAPVIQQQ